MSNSVGRAREVFQRRNKIRSWTLKARRVQNSPVREQGFGARWKCYPAEERSSQCQIRNRKKDGAALTAAVRSTGMLVSALTAILPSLGTFSPLFTRSYSSRPIRPHQPLLPYRESPSGRFQMLLAPFRLNSDLTCHKQPDKSANAVQA